jgi:hypothetical protein
MKLVALIMGQRVDPHISSVAQHLSSLGVDVLIFDYHRDVATCDLLSDPASWPLSEALSNYDGIVIWPRHKPFFTDEGTVAMPFGPNHSLDQEMQRHFWHAEWREFNNAFIHSLLLRYSHAWAINYMGKSRTAYLKPLQLEVARSLSMTIPRTVVTSDPTSVEALGASEIVYKPIASEFFSKKGVPPVVELPVHLCQASLKENRSLGIFQVRVPKDHELRVTVFGETVVTARIESQEMEGTSLDWRWAAAKGSMFGPAETSPELRAFTLAFLRAFDLDIGAFDFAVTPDRQLVFFECNPAGQWMWLESSGVELATHMANLLYDRAKQSAFQGRKSRVDRMVRSG